MGIVDVEKMQVNKDVEGLIEALKDKDWEVRSSAAKALVKIGEPAVPALVEALQSEDEHVWSSAIYILGEIGEIAVEPLLSVLTKNKDEDVLSRVVPTLGRIGQPAVQHLRVALKESRFNGDGQLYAAIALEGIGKTTIDCLQMLVMDENPAVRHVASKALLKFAEQPQDTKTLIDERRISAHGDWVSGAKRLLNRLSYTFSKKSLDVPTTYDPALHYNCFLQNAVSAERRQAVYQELRRMGKIRASHYLPSGQLQLIVSDLKAGIDAACAVIDSLIRDVVRPSAVLLATLKHDRDNLSALSREGVTVFVYHEPEPLETVTAARFVRIANKTISDLKSDESSITIFRTTASQFQKNATVLPPETTLLYRSQVYEFWHYIFVHRVDEGFIYGQNNRKVLLSYCVDESGQVLLCTAGDIRKKLFPSEHELSEHELEDILVAYTYKSYSETAEALFKTFEAHAN